jgi:hypothetical protein
MSDLMKVLVRCVIALVLALGVKSLFTGYWELVADVTLVVGFIVCGLAQHEWKFSVLDLQAWKEVFFSAAVILLIYAL